MFSKHYILSYSLNIVASSSIWNMKRPLQLPLYTMNRQSYVQQKKQILRRDKLLGVTRCILDVIIEKQIPF